MIDRELIRLLDERGVAHCLIGAAAIAVHGWARYSADVDLLTMDPQVLEPGFWSRHPAVEIRSGDLDDPLAGVVRWPADIPHDVIVGRKRVMRLAVETAEMVPSVGCRVATPLCIVLLKLEAGGAQDRHDIVSLIQTRRAIDGAPWLQEVSARVSLVSKRGQRIWQQLERELSP